MRWAGRRPRSAIVLGAVIAAFAASACFGGAPAPPAPPPPPPQQLPPPPPPPQAQACQSAGAASPEAGKDEPARPPSDQAIPPDDAGARAREVASTTEVRTKSGEIPLVTVEERGGRPEITTTAVRSPDEAAAVAERKAAEGDLHAVDVDRPVKASFTTPNDTRFGEQWAFSKVPYVNAWNTDNTQGAGVTVAVVDTGVQQSHPDLAGQVLSGHFFLHDKGGATAFEGSGGTSDPSSHGTHVAGTIAALSNNTTGVSGAAPGVKILPVQVLCGDGGGFSSDVANGIIWAVDNGANVVNLSLGGGPDSAYLSAIDWADSNNVVVVAAGGNDGAGGAASYPAAYSGSPWNKPNVIAVAAVTNTTPPGHASYGTLGNYLDLSAPGGENGNSSAAILSTVPGGYGTKAGTSMATPHVSAAAALLRAAANCSDSQVKSRLIATAVDLGSLGKDSTFGYGLVEPNAAGKTC
jgi:serine protease